MTRSGRTGTALRRYGPPALLLLAFLLLYARSLTYPFVNWDDPIHVYRNPAIVRPLELSWCDRWLPRTLGYPMPLTILSYRLDAALFLRSGLEGTRGAPGFHATNLALALLLIVLVYHLCQQLLKDRYAALAACCLFAFHPILVEPVVWISGRKDLLSASLSVAAIISWLRFLDSRCPRHAIGFALLGVAALLGKPNAIYLVAMAMYLLLTHRDRTSFDDKPARTAYVAGAAIVVVAALGAAIAVVGQQWNRNVGGVVSGLTVFDVLRRVVWGLGFHLSMLIAPIGLRAKYIVAPGPLSVFDVAGLAAIIICAAALWRTRRNPDALGFGIAYFVASYLPVSSIIPLQRFIADSYLLLPLLGLVIAAGAVLARVQRYGSRGYRGTIAASTWIVVLMLATLTWKQVGVWRSSVALWEHNMRYHGDHPQICRMLGHAYGERGELTKALAVYERCKTQLGLAPFANNIAITNFMLGDYVKAHEMFRWIERHNPNDARARRYLRLIAQRLAERRAAGASSPPKPATTE